MLRLVFRVIWLVFGCGVVISNILVFGINVCILSCILFVLGGKLIKMIWVFLFYNILLKKCVISLFNIGLCYISGWFSGIKNLGLMICMLFSVFVGMSLLFFEVFSGLIGRLKIFGMEEL